MSERPICVECGAQSPEWNTNYTLISKTGWRLKRVKQADGQPALEWRCSACWSKVRAENAARVGASLPPRRPTGK